MEFTGITFAGKGQNLDTGAKVVHAAPETSSYTIRGLFQKTVESVRLEAV